MAIKQSIEASKVRICIIDYGMGNHQSVRNALERIGCEVEVSANPKKLLGSDGLILPGVGAFGEAMYKLHEYKLIDPLMKAVIEDQKPLLGICLGMQLLADNSSEGGGAQGLSLIPGVVTKIPESVGLRLPHMGWNDISIRIRNPIFDKTPDKSAFYFVHSYHLECDSRYISAVTEHGINIAAAIQREHIFGVQFHPERSQRKGLHLLSNFIDFVALRATFAGK